jgi:pimeloyl-ACP methyl ester carboxylesterase
LERERKKMMKAQLRRFLFLTYAVTFSVLANAQAPPAMPPEKVAVVMGEHIHYYEAGQGPVVILLHGLGSNAGIWVNNIVPLAAHYHVYAPDQIGFGHSDKPLLDYKIQTFVEFLQGFMESQNIQKAVLVGNSLGGWIATDFTAQHPDLVSKLVLVNSAGLHFGQGPVPDLNPSSLAGMRQVLELIFYNKQMVTDELVHYAFTNHLKDNDGYTVQRTLAGFARDQFEESKLASIHAPTLIIWGRNDDLIPLSKGEQFHQGIAGSKLAVIDQCGHVPELEKPAEFDRVLGEFLAQQ